jgi:hypothetical protein
VNLTTDCVDNGTSIPVGRVGNYQVPRSDPRPPGEPDTCLNCYSLKMLNGRVLLFWIVTLLEVAERLRGPADTSLINFRVLKIM